MPIAKLYDPTLGFRVLPKDRIYVGEQGLPTQNIVPNKGDLIFDRDKEQFSIVRSVAPSPSHISVLEPLDLLTDQINAKEELLSGLSNYQPHIAHRAFYNDQVTPKTIMIDHRAYVYGTDYTVCKLFKGYDTSVDGVVISQTYGSSGQVTGENVDLELLDPNNQAIKRPGVINTSHDLEDGDVVTLVAYSPTGGPGGSISFVVNKTSAIRPVDMVTKTIVDVVLVSSYLDPQDSNKIILPANIPLNGNNFAARLVYNDGSTADINIDGTKCRLVGIDNFNVGEAGSIAQAVLLYYPDSNEPFINGNNASLAHMSRTYNVQANIVDSNYAYKVFLVPSWNGTTFDVDYYLANLDRNILIKIPSAEMTATKPNGDPLDYNPSGPLQTLDISVNVDNLVPDNLNGFVHTQTVKIQFGSMSGPTAGTPWLIDYVGDNNNVYGNNFGYTFTDTGPTIQLEMTRGPADGPINSPADAQMWLDDQYNPLYPLYNPNTEPNAPDPSHVTIIGPDGTEHTEEYDLTNPSGPFLEVSKSVAWQAGQTVTLVFKRTDPSNVSGPKQTLAVGAIYLTT